MNIETQSQPQKIDATQYVQDIAFSPVGFVLVLCAAYWAWLQFKGSSTPRKGVLARGKMAGTEHERNSMTEAHKTIKSQRKDKTASWIGTPAGLRIQRNQSVQSIELPEDLETLWLTDSEGGTFVIGAPGSGKSFTFIFPQLMSYINQGCASRHGLPIAFFDFKYSTHTKDDPCPTSRLAGYAIKRGYKFHLFAPGLPESGVINLLDFLRHDEDVEMARQLIFVLCRSLIPGWAQVVPFFRDGAVSFLTGLILIAKKTAKPDLLTARMILRTYGIEGIVNHPSVSENVRLVFDQVIDCMQSADAFAGVKATVSQFFSMLLMPAIAPSICGTSTIPLDLHSNQFLSYGLDGERKDVTRPLLSAVIELMATRNFLRPRKNACVFSFDEVGQLKIDDLGDWPNVYRSAGLILQVATQSMEVLERYNDAAWAKRLVKGCNTRVIFKLNDHKDASEFSDAVGKEDQNYKTTSVSSGKNSGSTSEGEHRQTISLLEGNEVTQFLQGKFLIYNEGMKDKHSQRVPLVKQMKLPQWDIDAIADSVKAWPTIYDKLMKGGGLKPLENKDYEERKEAIAVIFGLAQDTPDEEPEEVQGRSASELLQEALELMNIEESLGLKPQLAN